LFLLLSVGTLLGQKRFEQGYYIDHSGKTTEAEIELVDIYNMPREITAKSAGKVSNVSIADLKGLKVGTQVFVRKIFDYDASVSYSIDKLNRSADFTYEKKDDLLLLLVNGDYKLYQYVANGVSSFIYEDPDNNLYTLEYKKYKEEGNRIAENKAFQKQLENNATNPKNRSYEVLKYNNRDLEEYFESLNGKTLIQEKKSTLSFNVFATYSIHSLAFKFGAKTRTQNDSYFSISPELEFVLNSKVKNPSAFYLNVKYEKFEREYETDYIRETAYFKVEHHAFFGSFGYKQYFRIKKGMFVYGKAGVGYYHPFNSKITASDATSAFLDMNFNTANGGVNTGVGFKLGRILLEVDYDMIFSSMISSNNTSLNFKVGYSF